MIDKLKERVNNNRQEWEVQNIEFDEQWDTIASRLDKNELNIKKGYSSIWLKVAASVVMVLGVSWMMINITAVSQHEDGYALSELSQELAEIELFYVSQISEKLAVISTSNTELDDVAQDNLALLDSAYNELKLDLKDNIDNEEVVSAMIENYRIRLQILEQVLHELNKNNFENEQTNEVNI